MGLGAVNALFSSCSKKEIVSVGDRKSLSTHQLQILFESTIEAYIFPLLNIFFIS